MTPVPISAPTNAAAPASRHWRRLWISIGGVAVGTGLFVGLLLMPPVQGWLVRKYVGSHSGWRVGFDKFSAGLNGIEIRGLDFAMPGMQARSAPIEVRIAPGRLLNQRELRIERADAQKLIVTLTPAELPTSNAPSTRSFTGVMPLLQSPLAWGLDDAHLDGEIVVRDGDRSIVIGTFQINGGGVAAEKTGKFTYEVAINSALLPPGPENKLRSRGVVRLVQGRKHGMERISIEGDLALPRFGKIALPPGKFALDVTATTTGENYRAHLELGPVGTVEVTGMLDGIRSALTGHLAVRADQSLVASLAGDKLPIVTLKTEADFTLDLRRGDFEATFAADLDASDWGRVAPELTVIDAFKGRIAGAFALRNGKASVDRFSASLEGTKTPAALRLELTRPIDPAALPHVPVATVSLDHWPLQWLNPWLVSSRVVIDPGEFGGAWNVVFAPDGMLQLVSVRPCELGPIAVRGERMPPLPPLKISFSPRIELSATGAALAIDDFAATTTQGDRIAAKFSATYELEKKIARTQGELSGAIPTLLSGPEQPLPFSLNARWNLAVADKHLQAGTLEFTARKDATSPPCLALQLLQPITVDLEQLTAPVSAVTPDWARLKFDQLPIGWISRWLQRYQIGGFLALGESVLRSGADGQLTLVTPTPWQLSDATFAVGGQTLLQGELCVTPTFGVRNGRYTAQFADIQGRDAKGNRVTGLITAEAQLKDRLGSAILALEIDLPALPHSAETFGALHASLRATSHSESPTIVALDTFDLRVRNQQRDLLAIEAPRPFLVGLSNAGMFTAGTLAPLKLTVAEIPLGWARPWIAGIELEGLLQPTEFTLTTHNAKYLLRPTRPVNVREFAARIGTRDVAHDMDFTVSPALDLTLVCRPFPKFELAYSGTAHFAQGAMEVGGRRAIDVDAALSFVGNTTMALPSGIELTARGDFAELNRVPALARGGIPPGGAFVARLNGDILGGLPLELWSRIEGVSAADGSRTLPALEIFANGKVSRDETVAGGVEMRLAALPHASDAKFDVKLNLRNGNLEIASGFRSSYLDANDALAFAEAFHPKSGQVETSSITPPAAGRSHSKNASYQQLGTPFWAALRGHFDLDIGALVHDHYRIDHVRGRLDLRDRELVLSDLRGEMFAGRWSGHVRIDYQPDNNKSADHALAGDFHIEQFDSARVVQTVFPTELASVDARIDLHSTVRSQGNALFGMLDRTEGEFTVEGRQGLVRLTVPKQDMAATAAVFGGALLLSPELRALGRLMRKFAEMPVNELRITGERTTSGDVRLNEFRLDSPQARFFATGNIPALEGQPLMNRPMQLSIDLAARDEMAVILGGMSLIEKKPRADGYRALKEKFTLGGKAGAPDTRPLYDLLAKAVVGSKGTWGFLMRKMQDQLNKTKAGDPKKTAATTGIGAIP